LAPGLPQAAGPGAAGRRFLQARWTAAEGRLSSHAQLSIGANSTWMCRLTA
jgi:hypothetical protein